jgi:23S rRNA pseudouridine1911/1915/1917 synthase
MDRQAVGKGKMDKQAVGKGKLDKQTAGKGGMEKIYQAAVCLDPVSYPLAVEGMKKEVFLEDCLGRDRSTNMAYVAAPGEQGAKLARLSFHTIWIRDSRALLEIRLYTGRHHQIRVQMAHASMPLAGDRKYGKGEEELPLCLCAARLAFLHPVTGRKMEFCVTPSWLPLV